jgi:hypothetical protein
MSKRKVYDDYPTSNILMVVKTQMLVLWILTMLSQSQYIVPTALPPT